MTRHRSAARPGFTLLELLLAMSVATMLGLTLYLSMSIAFRARGTVNVQTEAPRMAAIALDLLGGDLQGAIRPIPSSGLSTPFIGLSTGGSGGDTLTFSTADKRGGASFITLGIRADATGASLVRRGNGRALASTVTQPVDSTLLRDVSGLTVRYFDGYGWVDSWDSRNYEDKLPVAVEFTVVLNLPDPVQPKQNYRMSRIIPLPHSSLVATVAEETDEAAE